MKDRKLSYEEWVDYCFDRPISDPQWYFQDDEQGDPLDWYSPSQIVINSYLEQLFTNCADLPIRYAQDQIGQGLWFILSNICSGYLVLAVDPTIPKEKQIAVYLSLKQLYVDLFRPICGHYLGHQSQGGPINTVCYMLWDMGPQLPAMFPERRGREHLVDPIFSILSYALTLSSAACQESALHGLGHLKQYHESRVTELIDAYLSSADSISEALKSYARRARTGQVM